MSKILAIDFGMKRTGLAITDSMQIIASPLETIDTSKIFDHLKNLVPKEKVIVSVILSL